MFSLIVVLVQPVFAQVPGYKIKNAMTVYETIAIAYGTGMNAPKLELVPGKNRITMYYPGEQAKIVLDEYAYDLCTGFGRDSLNALAALLGHELAHHFEKHDWCTSFAFMLGKDDPLAKRISKIAKEQKESEESQADYYGGFFGYVAGYSTYSIIPKLIDKIYEAYKLPEKIEGYPSKTERKAIAGKRFEEFNNLLVVFDAGEVMFALKEYGWAAACFDYLCEKFPSREMFSNAGVSRVFNALEYIDTREMPFILPLEFDPATRLKTGTTRGTGLSDIEKKNLSDKLLHEAIRCFDKAISRDPAYLNAQINKGCSYLLLKNFAMAEGIAEEIIKNKNNATGKYDFAKAYTLKAITAWSNKKDEYSKMYFDMALLAVENTTTVFNRKAYDELNKSVFDEFIDWFYSYFDSEVQKSAYGTEKIFNPAVEKIGGETASGISLAKLMNDGHVVSNGNFAVTFTRQDDGISMILSQHKNQIKILEALPGYKFSTSQGIHIQSPLTDVKKQYGEPTYALNVVQGEYMVYRKSRIIFLIGKTGRVNKWFLYDREFL